MNLTSDAFGDGERIPPKHSCDGANVNPPLDISGVPPKTKSLVLIMDDPDVPKSVRPDGMWVHWVVWNIDPATESISEDSVPVGAVEGMTDFGQPGYGGPCPPDREHRYFFKLYALDTEISLPSSATKIKVEQAMKGHILAQTELVGLYER